MISFDIVKELSELIAIPSLSRKEDDALIQVEKLFKERDIPYETSKNNLFAKNKSFQKGKMTVLLNSHIDTVKANTGYTKDPHAPIIEDGKLYGLGSNDAGGALMGLMGAFFELYDKEDLNYNLVFAASAEEEISGKNGMEYLFPLLPPIDFAIVGEPTQMEISTAERGLMVLDVKTKGVSGHAARKEGINAISKAIEDIQWFHSYNFPKISDELGPISMSVTGINAGTQHNVVPDLCEFMVDVRINDLYSNEEVLTIIKSNVKSEVNARSTRLNSSGVSPNHPIRKVAKQLSINTYGSPTSSDQALIPCESVKIGPGDSARSHTADEFIYIQELEEAIPKYLQILKTLNDLI